MTEDCECLGCGERGTETSWRDRRLVARSPSEGAKEDEDSISLILPGMNSRSCRNQILSLASHVPTHMETALRGPSVSSPRPVSCVFPDGKSKGLNASLGIASGATASVRRAAERESLGDRRQRTNSENFHRGRGTSTCLSIGTGCVATTGTCTGDTSQKVPGLDAEKISATIEHPDRVIDVTIGWLACTSFHGTPWIWFAELLDLSPALCFAWTSNLP